MAPGPKTLLAYVRGVHCTTMRLTPSINQFNISTSGSQKSCFSQVTWFVNKWNIQNVQNIEFTSNSAQFAFNFISLTWVLSVLKILELRSGPNSVYPVPKNAVSANIWRVVRNEMYESTRILTIHRILFTLLLISVLFHAYWVFWKFSILQTETKKKTCLESSLETKIY